jgi:hypothetical protein
VRNCCHETYLKAFIVVGRDILSDMLFFEDDLKSFLVFESNYSKRSRIFVGCFMYEDEKSSWRGT